MFLPSHQVFSKMISFLEKMLTSHLMYSFHFSFLLHETICQKEDKSAHKKWHTRKRLLIVEYHQILLWCECFLPWILTDIHKCGFSYTCLSPGGIFWDCDTESLLFGEIEEGNQHALTVCKIISKDPRELYVFFIPVVPTSMSLNFQLWCYICLAWCKSAR